MKRITSLDDAPAVLEAYGATRGIRHRMSLDYMQGLMSYLGNPQDDCRAIHVAGTSGKTSTAYYAAALLTKAGKRVGLTVSPHIDCVNERVQISMEPLPAKEFVAEINEFLSLIERGGFKPSYFELLCAFAFWEFARQQVDYNVIEVGVGGLLDNTNVMSRSDKVCVLTDIGYDHMSVLGDTLPEIAGHKAGIIGLHNAVFCWQQSSEIVEVFRTAAHQKQADLHILSTPHWNDKLAFLPSFQRRNFELALEAVQYVLQRDGHDPLPQSGVLEAAEAVIPARMETRNIDGKTVIIDGSHNPQKLQALVASIGERFPGKPVAVLVGFAKSKTPENRIAGGTKELIPFAAHLIITKFVIGRNQPHSSVDPAAVAAVCEAEGYASFEVIDDPKRALTVLLKRPEPIVLIVGSFYLLNTIRPLLAPSHVK